MNDKDHSDNEHRDVEDRQASTHIPTAAGLRALLESGQSSIESGQRGTSPAGLEYTVEQAAYILQSGINNLRIARELAEKYNIDLT